MKGIGKDVGTVPWPTYKYVRAPIAQMADPLFRPMHEIDRLIRPRVWVKKRW